MMTQHDKKENIRWTGFAASIPGGGHIRRGIPCQDASAVMTAPRPAVIVCDGRGSAKLSHFGAQGAVDAFRFQVSVLEPFLVNILDGEEEKTEQWVKFCRIMYRTLMQVKYDLAEKHQENEKEFDCTVAFAIAGEKHIGCFQVGDGSIVLRQNGVCKTVFLPEKGEFANQTHFLRAGGEEQMKFQHALLDSDVNSGIAITSDGPEHLMFHLADMTPGKIFDMLLDDLRKEELCRQDLMDYLTRREWADDPRGSDDRSLALLARIGDAPAVKPESKQEPEPTQEPPKQEPTQEPTKQEPKQEPTKQEPTKQEPTKQEPTQEPPKQEQTQEPEPTQEPPKQEPTQEPEPKQEQTQEPEPKQEQEPMKAKKKGISCWTLALVSALTVGLLAETACLLIQRQTIVRQKEMIQLLDQRLAEKKAGSSKTSESREPVPASVREIAVRVPDGAPSGMQDVKQQFTPEVPMQETEPLPPCEEEKEDASAASPETAGNTEIKNIHKEETHDEK